jgi:hypothetical protein
VLNETYDFVAAILAFDRRQRKKALLVVAANLAVDLCHALLDPRVRLE